MNFILRWSCFVIPPAVTSLFRVFKIRLSNFLTGFMSISLYVLLSTSRSSTFLTYSCLSITTVMRPLSDGTMTISFSSFEFLQSFLFLWGQLVVLLHPLS